MRRGPENWKGEAPGRDQDLTPRPAHGDEAADPEGTPTGHSISRLMVVGKSAVPFWARQAVCLRERPGSPETRPAKEGAILTKQR